MNNLTIPKGNIEVTSLQIAQWTGKEHGHVMRDIKKELEGLGEVGQSIFRLTSYIDSFNRKQPCYTMNLDGVMQLPLKYDAVSRYKCIQKLKELEQPKQYTLKESLQMNLQLLEDNEKLQKEKESLLPKAEYYDTVLQSDKLVTITSIAKDLGMPVQKLNKLLHLKGLIYKDGGIWYLYAKYERMIPEHFDYVINEYGQHLKVTEMGRKFIIKFIGGNTDGE